MSALLGQLWMPSGVDLFRFSPELVLVGTLVAILVVPLVLGRSAGLTGTIALVGVGIATWLTVRVGVEVRGEGFSGLAPSASSGMLIADNVGVFFKIMVLGFAACVTVLWWIGSAETERDAPEFFVLLLGSAVGMCLMAGTLNLLMMLVAIEMASLPSYAIVGFAKRDRRAAEVSLKYAVFGAVSAAIMLYGISLLYGLYQSLNFVDVAGGVVADLVAGRRVVTLGAGLACLFCGIGFKISAVPFHFWCPDAFEGARIEVTTWLSVVSKAAGLILLARLVHTLSAAGGAAGALDSLAPLAWGIGIVAMLTCTVGNLAAYKQSSVKRLLAYSSVAHAGYMLMAVAIFAVPGSTGVSEGMAALLTYVAIYLVMNLGAFGVVALVYWQTGSDSIDAFNGLIRRAPWLAVAMLFCLMSLVGLPPFAGFMGKYWILYALGQQGDAANWLYWILFLVAVINTLISLYYYLRVVVRMMLADDGQPEVRAPLGGTVLVTVCGALLIAMLIFAQPIKHWADRHAVNLYAPPVATADAGGNTGELPTGTTWRP
ncbi:MAG: NADH-quinone oxidoreductase subunit N [Phycisphaerae bacterium]